ncbi:hypothetical protein PMIN01_08972 [Paraphaeosphaeria minitans]|uniref:Uncharacterized protein n=1 Tax=Paraphaeosphaeria minitans TaxID=565426 RepID=A0A9P6GD90_9PLEO|nr:hypothetical protein PMIN01_08972 [Paraphaeosphaeria minitans]
MSGAIGDRASPTLQGPLAASVDGLPGGKSAEPSITSTASARRTMGELENLSPGPRPARACLCLATTGLPPHPKDRRNLPPMMPHDMTSCFHDCRTRSRPLDPEALMSALVVCAAIGMLALLQRSRLVVCILVLFRVPKTLDDSYGCVCGPVAGGAHRIARLLAAPERRVPKNNTSFDSIVFDTVCVALIFASGSFASFPWRDAVADQLYPDKTSISQAKAEHRMHFRG